MLSTVDSEHGRNHKQRNKLRTYKTFKRSYETETYVKCQSLTRMQRSALAKFRCGVAPLKIETGRYEQLAISDRVCFHCTSKVEDESHVLINCPLYSTLRQKLIEKSIEIDPRFSDFTDSQKIVFIMSNDKIINICAKTCNDILTERRKLLYK